MKTTKNSLQEAGCAPQAVCLPLMVGNDSFVLSCDLIMTVSIVFHDYFPILSQNHKLSNHFSPFYSDPFIINRLVFFLFFFAAAAAAAVPLRLCKQPLCM